MITPAYGLTATERVLPRLTLDFITASLDSRVTFARAANTATVIDSSGAVVLVNADVPRFDYTLGVGGACKGLLIEESRTNLLLNSVFDGAVAGSPGTAPTNWTAVAIGGSITNVSSGLYAAGNKITFTASGQRYFLIQSATVSVGVTYIATTIVNVISGSIAFDRIFTFGGGVVPDAFYVDGVVAAANTIITPGQKKLAVVKQVSGTSLEVRLGIGANAAVTGVVECQMPQLEAGAFPTSYIPTTTAALTRNADVATMTGTNFSDWYNSTEGGAVVQVLPSTISGTRPAVQFDDNTVDESITLRGVGADPQLFVVDGGVTQATLDAGTITANTLYKLGGAWKDASYAVAINGSAPVTQASGTFPTSTQARLGSDGTNYLNGHLQNLRFWPQRLTDAEVQAFSK